MVNVSSSRITCTSKNEILFCFLFAIENDMLACQRFRKFWKTSECSEVNTTKIYEHTAGSNKA